MLSSPAPTSYPLAYNNYYCQPTNINHYANYNDTMTRTLLQQTPAPVFNCAIPPPPSPLSPPTTNIMSGNQNSQLSTIPSINTAEAAASASAGTATAAANAANGAVANQQQKNEINSCYQSIINNCSAANTITKTNGDNTILVNVLNNHEDNNNILTSSSSSSSNSNNIFMAHYIANNHNHNNKNINIKIVNNSNNNQQQQQNSEEQEISNSSKNSSSSTTIQKFSCNNSEHNSNSLINSINNFVSNSNSNLICKGNSNCNNVVTSSSYLAYANNTNNNTTTLVNNNSNNSVSHSNGGNNFTHLGNNNNNNNGQMMTSGNNNNNDNINSSLNNYTNISYNNKINDSSCLTNTTTTTNTITTNTSTVTNNLLTDTLNSTNTDSSSPKLNTTDKYALMNNNNNKSITDKNLGDTLVADGVDSHTDKDTPSPIPASSVANFNGISDSSNNNNNNHSHYKHLSNHLNEETENKTQDEYQRNPFILQASGENFNEKSTTVTNDAITTNGTDKSNNMETATVNGGLVAIKATTSSAGILPTPSSAPATMVNTSNAYTNPYQQNLRYYNPFVSAAAAVPGVSYPQAVVSSSFSMSQPQFSFAATPTYSYGTYASAPPTPTGVSSAASYYATDPAALAKEVAQKNYAHAVKMAASANPLAGKPLTAASYTGMSLNKSYTHAPTTSNMQAQHAAFFQAQHAQAAAAMAAAQMRSMAANSLPGSSLSTPVHTPTHQASNLLQRSATTGYLPAGSAQALNMLRPQTMAMSAPTQGAAYAALAQQPQAFFYPGMMAAPTGYPFATAMSGMPTAIAPTAATAAPGTALVLNPYKKMKTS